MKYLQESVGSVLNQTYRDFEFLICDDCSTDESYTYLKTLNDPRIKLCRNETNKGLFPTLNLLIKQSNAELVHLWAQDDMMYPNCLEETLKFHEKFPEVSFSFSRWHTINENGDIIGKVFECDDHTISPIGHAKSSILYGSIAGNIANVTIVKSEVEKAGYFNENMKYCGDFEMWYKLTLTKHAGLSGKYLIKLRNHSGQLSRNLEASYFKLKENLSIYQHFLQSLPENKQKYGRKALLWKIYPQYFNQLLYLVFKIKMGLAKLYFSTLIKYDNIFRLAYRWAIIKLLRLIKMEYKFYKKNFINKF
jgi:glycosyltransferase involved in cell wall biosynthesis